MQKINTPIIPIGYLADVLNIHQRTLRIYDKEKILSPTRTKKNRRCYTMKDIQKAYLILFLTRNLSINLNGVKIILLLLQKQNIKQEDCIQYLNKLAKSIDIGDEIQENNMLKNSKKGRRLN